MSSNTPTVPFDKSALDAAILDIKKDGVEDLVTEQFIVLPKLVTIPHQGLTFLSGRNGFLRAELNSGEGYIRQKHA